MDSYLAVDVGGTSTRALLVTDAGRVTGTGTAGRGNPTSSDLNDTARALTSTIQSALATTGLEPSAVAGTAIAIAGSTPHSREQLREVLGAAGLTRNISFHPDLLATYHSGTLSPAGYAVVCGTGAIAARVRYGRLDATSDGVGWLLGDDGSGFWIGRHVVRAVAGALDARRPPTALTEMLLDELGIQAPPPVSAGGTADDGRGDDGRLRVLGALVETVYNQAPIELAGFAPLAFRAADDGDDVARRIVDEAGRRLKRTVATVIDPTLPGPIVLGGSILSKQPALSHQLVESLRAAGLTGTLVPVPDGTTGAAVLALRHSGIPVDDLVFAQLRASAVLRR
ncbi:BadF/BadG/BcrA/BcrD ATPase family protein [soil metagenome]